MRICYRVALRWNNDGWRQELFKACGIAEWLADGIRSEKGAMGLPDPDIVYKIRKSGERVHRKAVRLALQKLCLYEEWDTAAQEWPSEAESVNRIDDKDVSF